MTNQQLKQLKPRFQVHYQKSKDNLVPINDLLNWGRRNSSWKFSKRFYELRVAHYHNLRNYEWDAIEDEDKKAEMIAFYNSENKIVSYDAHLRELEAKSKKKKK